LLLVSLCSRSFKTPFTDSLVWCHVHEYYFLQTAGAGRVVSTSVLSRHLPGGTDWSSEYS